MRISMKKLGASLFTFTLLGVLLSACDPSAPESEISADSVEQTKQALLICPGSVVKSGTITNMGGTQIGTVDLYYNAATHSICGRASFYTASTFNICATNNSNVSQPPQCTGYMTATTLITPSQSLGLFDFGSTTVLVSSPLGSGGAGFYQRTS